MSPKDRPQHHHAGAAHCVKFHATESGFKRRAVDSFRDRNGFEIPALTTMPKKTPWTVADCERLKSLAASGASAVRCALALKRTVQTTRVKARDMGIPFPHEVKQRIARRRLLMEVTQRDRLA